MKAILNYLCKNELALLITFGVVFIAYAVFFTHVNWSIGQYIVSIIFIVAGIYKQRERKLKEEQLRKKGLTTVDLLNIEFVKNWDHIRKKGVYRYCMLDGGIITGMILFIPVSFIAFFILGFSVENRVFNEFSDMISFTGYCFFISYTIGGVLYYIRWKGNEQKFENLTDPLARY